MIIVNNSYKENEVYEGINKFIKNKKRNSNNYNGTDEYSNWIILQCVCNRNR